MYATYLKKQEADGSWDSREAGCIRFLNAREKDPASMDGLDELEDSPNAAGQRAFRAPTGILVRWA